MIRQLRVLRRDLATSDDDLVARLAHGDLDGLSGLYDRHAGALAKLASRLGAGVDVEDVVHAVFLRAVDLAPRFEAGRGSARAWFAGITVKIMRERRRSGARWLRALGAFAREPSALASHDASAPTDLHRALATLPAAQREALVLVDGAGLTALEAGDALGVPVGTVWSRLHHGRAALRVHFGDDQ